MHLRKHNDQGFDDFRRERKRQRARLATPTAAVGYENQALRELEQVEAREFQDQRLTREVHEFFASATRQAAGIVERVSRDAQVETGARVEQQMEAFLIDALARMNTFVVTVLQQRRSQVAETRMEPKVGNLVGPVLDEFRWEGTAEVGDKHIGQDPFATDVDEVQRDFRAQVGEPDVAEADACPIDEHLVARVYSDDEDLEQGSPDADEPSESMENPAALESAEHGDAVEHNADDQSAPVPAENARSAAPSKKLQELERFKTALMTLVRHGTLSREEARAAWETRLQSIGFKS